MKGLYVKELSKYKKQDEFLLDKGGTVFELDKYESDKESSFDGVTVYGKMFRNKEE